jgi:basic amino acid/polyamine antiporter, APA family
LASEQELAKSAGVTVFRRSSSGLTRQFGALDVLIYNVAWSMLLIPGAAYLYLQGYFAFPNGDIVGAVLLTALWATPMFVSYSMLASSMPRSGGDYVWQSRILHGSIGFTTMMIMAFSLFIWIALNGWWVTAFSTSPMFTALGVQLNNNSLVQLGTWLSTPIGIFVGTILVNVGVFFMFLPGITPGLKAGRYGFIFVVIAMGALTAYMGLTSHDSWVSAYNGLMGNSLLGTGQNNFYSYVMSAATTSGYVTQPANNIFHTIGMGALVWIVLAWPMWVFLNLGEVKGAESLKRTTSLTVGSLLLATAFMAIWGYELINMVGKDFLGAAGWLFYSPPAANVFAGFPITPYYTNLVSALGTAPAILIGLGTLAIGIWECWVNYVGGSRIMLAASLDRVWPEWFGRVGRRFRQLVNVGITYLVMGIIVGYLYNFSIFFNYTLYTSLAASFFQFFTMVAAIAFPYRKRMANTWNTSPAKRWAIAGVPIIVLGGVAGLTLQGTLIYYELTVANLLINSTASLTAFGALIVGLGAYYFATRQYQRGKGIDIELAFSEVPPL